MEPSNLNNYSKIIDHVNRFGCIPDSFEDYHLSDEEGYTVAHYLAARPNYLPKTFKDYHLANHLGWTVAHEAALHTSLPEWFKDYQWADRADRGGWTVAHIAAARGILPAWFDAYHLKNKNGLTVAHDAALSGTLPAKFNDWHLYCKHAGTVINLFIKNGMEGWPDRSSLFALKVNPTPESPTVAEYIILNQDKIVGDMRAILQGEAMAWLAAQEIKESLDRRCHPINATFNR